MKGYRAFKVRGDGQEFFLVPASNGRVDDLDYPNGRATCGGGRGGYYTHPAPAANCRCGYYAYKEVAGALTFAHHQNMEIFAEVWGHGRVEEHEAGWRSARMQIIHFYWPMCENCSSEATRWKPGYVGQLKEELVNRVEPREEAE